MLALGARSDELSIIGTLYRDRRIIKMLDLLFKGGTIVDGSGTPWYRGSLGIANGKIASVQMGEDVSQDAHRVIDVSGLIISPGFIDAHSHSDFIFFRDPRPDMKISQGVTTEIAGNCGFSSAPLTEKSLDLLGPDVAETVESVGRYETFGEYLQQIEDHGLINNQAVLVGHKPIRTAVMGMEARPASPEEIETMKRLLSSALDEGAIGFSTGLLYPPMCFAEIEELIELCRVVAARGKIYTCHMRNYSSEIFSSVRENVEIAEKSGVSLQISHLMIAGQGNWGQAEQLLALIDDTRERGIDVTLDQYPYCAANPRLWALMPPWMHEGGTDKMLERLRDPELRERASEDVEKGLPGWENISQEAGWENLVIMSDRLEKLSGRSVEEIADSQQQAPATIVFDILLEDPQARVIAHWVNDADVRRIMQHGCHMVGSDSIYPGPFAHPRTFGTYPRILGEYVREKKVLSWEEAIQKMTFSPARRFGLHNRGLISEGWVADLVVFDPEMVGTESTFQHPDVYPSGIECVILNGMVVVERNEHNGSAVGKVLKAD